MLFAEKFTPEVLIEAPRRGPAVPNHDGTQAVFTCSTHTIGGDTLKEVLVMDLDTGDSRQLTSSAKVHDAQWLGHEPNTVAFLESKEGGTTDLKVIDDVDATKDAKDPYVVAKLAGPVSNLKLKVLKDGSVALAVAGRVGEDGKLFNEEAEEKKLKSSIRAYDKFTFRYWDVYLKPQKYTIWISTLVRGSDGKWALSNPLRNLIPGSDIEAPMGMYDGLASAVGSFDLADRGVVFAAQDPENKKHADNGVSKVYYVPLESWPAAPASEAAGAAAAMEPQEIRVYKDLSKAWYANPRFSPDGRMVAFIRRSAHRIQDARIFVVRLGHQDALDVCQMVTGKEMELVPESFEFGNGGHSLLVTAQDCGRVGLYELRLQPGASLTTVFKSGSVSAFYPLGGDDLLVTSSTFVESSLYHIVDAKSNADTRIVSSASKEGARLGLSPKQVSEIYFGGGGDYCVQAWVIKPRDFDESKKYPLALLVHGGPQSAFNDAWSTRWNLACWAEQGYIVVAPNFTGSTGFGLEHTERIFGNWGGYPYDDLVSCMEYLKDMPNLDLDNAIIAGASYGGYMMNWVQGNPLGRKFKAMVCHDGIFHLPSFMLHTDELGGVEDFHGPPYLWSNFDQLDKWNPARPELVRQWRTPMLVVHSDGDFRCPITEGIASYNTCQALGVPTRFVNFPDENHFVLKEENSLQWHREVFAWINRFSGVAKSRDSEGEEPRE